MSGFIAGFTGERCALCDEEIQEGHYVEYYLDELCHCRCVGCDCVDEEKVDLDDA